MLPVIYPYRSPNEKFLKTKLRVGVNSMLVIIDPRFEKETLTSILCNLDQKVLGLIIDKQETVILSGSLHAISMD